MAEAAKEARIERGCTQGMQVRRAIPADAPALAAMMLAFEDALNAMAQAPEEITVRTPAEAARMAARVLDPAGTATTLLAESGRRAGGYLICAPLPWMDDAAMALFVSDLYVADAARGAGVGRTLMEAAAALARAQGCSRLVWCLWRRNAPARAFYETLGATEIAEEALMTLPLA